MSPLTQFQRFTSAIPGGIAVKGALHNHSTTCGMMLWLSAPQRSQGFTVLTYHRVTEQIDPYYPLSYGMELSVFQAQMDVLRRFCSVLSLEEILTRLDGGKLLPKRCVAITFDDGYREVATHVWPIVKRYRLPMTLYVTIDALERGLLWPDVLRHAIRHATATRVVLETLSTVCDLSNETARLSAVQQLDSRLKQLPDVDKWRVLDELTQKLLGLTGRDLTVNGLTLTWDDVAALSNEGVDIGSHTVSHPILTRLSASEAADEIARSRRILTERLGRSIHHFAYPNGQPEDFSPQIQQAVAAAGFRSACSAVHGMNRMDEPRFALKRINGAQVSLRALIRIMEEETRRFNNGHR